MSRRQAFRAAAVLGSACIAVSGCASSAEAPDASVVPSLPFAVHDGETTGMEVELEGTLELIDGCLVIRDEGGYVAPLVLPRTATWDGERLGLGSRLVEVGEEITVGGGEYPREAALELGLPKTCPDGHAFYVG